MLSSDRALSRRIPARARTRRAVIVLLRGALVTLAGSGVACGTTAETSGGAVCTYEEVITCYTDAGCRGSQECLPDLTGYGPCTCGTDAGAGHDAAGSTAKDASHEGGK